MPARSASLSPSLSPSLTRSLSLALCCCLVFMSLSPTTIALLALLLCWSTISAAGASSSAWLGLMFLFRCYVSFALVIAIHRKQIHFHLFVNLWQSQQQLLLRSWLVAGRAGDWFLATANGVCSDVCVSLTHWLTDWAAVADVADVANVVADCCWRGMVGGGLTCVPALWTVSGASVAMAMALTLLFDWIMWQTQRQ